MSNIKPGVNIQGRAIVDSYSNGYFLMLPDGVINWHASKREVIKTVKSWAKKNSDNNKINVVEIEWR